jgi:sugar lactone lactonase YvrE
MGALRRPAIGALVAAVAIAAGLAATLAAVSARNGSQLAGAGPTPEQQLVGSYQLYSTEFRKADGTTSSAPWRRGKLTYTRDGDMSVVIREPTDWYTGTFNVRGEDRVVHHVQYANIESREGHPLVRRFELAGRRLTLTADVGGGGELLLHWRKVWQTGSGRVGEVRTLTRVPFPGMPEGIAVNPRNGSFWVGSNRPESRVVLWHSSRSGRLIRRYPVRGHSPSAEHGINGIALDGRGRAYALDYSGARAIRIDPATGRQTTYATFADLPLCETGERPCEPSSEDRQAWPNWATFDRDGNMYVSDLNQATIWKVPPGGGRARVWHQSADYASVFALNGMQFDARGRLVFANSITGVPGGPGPGVIYRIGVRKNGQPGTRTRLATVGIVDGFAIGRSGRIYAALPVDNVIQVVRPNGELGSRLPSPAVQERLDVPLNAPVSVAFVASSLLITNMSLFDMNPSRFAVLELAVGERGLPLHYPKLGRRARATTD